MCTKRRKSLQTLGRGDVQVHINSDRPGTGTDCLRSASRELGPWHGEVFQPPHIKAQQGFHGRRHHLESGAVVRVGASADCNIASEGIESYVELVARPMAISSRRRRRLPLMWHDENLRPIEAWLLFRDLTTHKSNAEKCTGESCWCT